MRSFIALLPPGENHDSEGLRSAGVRNKPGTWKPDRLSASQRTERNVCLRQMGTHCSDLRPERHGCSTGLCLESRRDLDIYAVSVMSIRVPIYCGLSPCTTRLARSRKGFHIFRL